MFALISEQIGDTTKSKTIKRTTGGRFKSNNKVIQIDGMTKRTTNDGRTANSL